MIARCFVAAMMLAAVVAASSAPLPSTTDAEGPDLVRWDIRINDGTTPGGAPGTPLATTISLAIDLPAITNLPPSEAALPDFVWFTNSAIEPQPGPGRAGTSMTASDIGARTATLQLRFQSNLIMYITANGNIPTAQPYAGYVPNCGDNTPEGITRIYGGQPGDVNLMIRTGPIIDLFNGTMTQFESGLRPDGLHAGSGFNPAQYGVEGAPGTPSSLFVQTYDDDNNNGYADDDPLDTGSAASKLEPDVNATGTADPYANSGTGEYRYAPGAPQTQLDYDHDGLPNAIEYMPDFLPLVADATGLAPFWVSRAYGVGEYFGSLVPGSDVHLMNFAGVPGAGSAQLVFIDDAPSTILNMPLSGFQNPYRPARAQWQGVTVCAPLSFILTQLAETGVTTICLTPCGPPPGVTGGDAVQQAGASSTGAASVLLSDTDDYDGDGAVWPADLCATSADNSDPDNDLSSGPCDPSPQSQDNDGDGNVDIAPNIVTLLAGTAACQTSGNMICDNDADTDRWINNVDNCPRDANAQQIDADGDRVGDACDAFVTIDTITGLASGKGDGISSSASLDNDLVCVDTFDLTLAEPATDGVPEGGCTDVADASDDGQPDAADFDSDEDGDGVSDAQEIIDGTNPLGESDSDADGMPDAYELAHPCLDRVVVDALLDGDLDGLNNIGEMLLGTLPCDPDTDNDGLLDGPESRNGTDPFIINPDPGDPDDDGDGCTDVEETGEVPDLGGDRDPHTKWDVFDVNGDFVNDLSDALDVLGLFGDDGTSATANLRDRQIADMLRPYAPVEADDGVDLTDAIVSLASFGHGCTGA